MNRVKLLQRVTTDHAILAGKPVVKGTRIPVAVILELIAEGADHQEILADYPDLDRQDITAALLFGSRLADFEELRVETSAAH